MLTISYQCSERWIAAVIGHNEICQNGEIIKAILILVAWPNLLYNTLANHINQHGFPFNVADSKWKWKKRQRGKIKSLAAMACQNTPRKPSGKMTQAALALVGTVVLARAHSELESTFPSLDVSEGMDGGGGQQQPEAGNGNGGE